MHTFTKIALMIIVVLALATVVPVAADDGGDEPAPCEGESVSGTVVAVDEASRTVTVDTGVGPCTVTLLDGEYDHPIVELLGRYFGDVSAESLTEALETTQGCAIYDVGIPVWIWADCAAGAYEVTVTGENEDGSFTAVVIVDGVEVTGILTVDDPATAAELSAALQTLTVDWNLDVDGGVIQPGDEIAAYHEDGMGFGVLVKLYAMAAESQEDCGDTEEMCGVTVEELVQAFQSGTGMGELFKEYRKPYLLGVGHVRNGGRERPDHVGLPKQARLSNQYGEPVDAGPNPKPKDKDNKPEHAGPKPKPADHSGRPEHAGPKPKDKAGKPEHAGPKPKSKGK